MVRLRAGLWLAYQCQVFCLYNVFEFRIDPSSKIWKATGGLIRGWWMVCLVLNRSQARADWR